MRETGVPERPGELMPRIGGRGYGIEVWIVAVVLALIVYVWFRHVAGFNQLPLLD